MTKFKTILADPPWDYKDQLDPTRHKPYSTLTVSQIKEIPIKELADEEAHLYLWVTNAFLREGLEIMEAWGFEYSNVIPWIKFTKSTSRLHFGMGRDFRNCTELLLFGVRGKLRTLTRNTRNIIMAPRPDLHSKKPTRAYTLIEKNSPPPRLELFARNKREGWEVWGNEVESTIKIDIE